MLARQLLDDALTRADQASLVVGATARLHIARVLTAFDKEDARALLIRALGEIKNLDRPRGEHHCIWYQARMLTAATAPDLVGTLPPMDGQTLRHSEFPFFRTMLDHGHVEAAFDFLMQFGNKAPFPQMAVPMVMRYFPDEEKKLALFRRATQAWRESLSAQPGDPIFRRPFGKFDFLSTFAAMSTILPKEEARAIARELAAAILRQEDYPMSARFGPNEQETFTSARQYYLFELLEPLRRLDPALADSLIETHAELAAAAEGFPLGMYSVHEAGAKRAAATEKVPGKRGYISAGGPEHRPFLEALMDGQESGQFAAAFREATSTFHQDVESNASVRECWASTQAFRSLLYSIAKSAGATGAVYLEQIPDPDLRLYSQIEFVAGLMGLPAYSGITVSSQRRPPSNP